MEELQDFKSQISDLKLQSEQISRQLRDWLDSLQNSQIKGQRHRNEQSRAQYEGTLASESSEAQRRQFMDELRQLVTESRGF